MPAELPETRLLNLIKRKNNFKPQAQKKAHKFKSWFFPQSRAINREFLALSHKVLKIVLLCLIGYFILTFLFPLLWESGLREPEVSDSEIAETLAEDIAVNLPQAENYPVYLKHINSRQLFETDFAKSALQAESEANLSEKFSLVGIISGDIPQAVIEDKQAQKTYYLKEGESFSGIKVEQVNEGKVSINYHGRQVELFL